MTRGRKRSPNLAVPAHIDPLKLPKGLYWDPSGTGRWYVLEPHPEGGRPKRKTVAQAGARLSELHDIIEQRAGAAARGTVDWLWKQFEKSTEFKALAKATRRDYEIHAALLTKYPTRTGTFGQLRVDALTVPVVQRLVEVLAAGKPESRPGADDAVKPRPSTANHTLRYMRRLFAWGIRFGHCATNPAEGVKQAKEASADKDAKRRKLPAGDAFTVALAFARERGSRKAHSAGSCPPYLAHVMEIAYACRLRGVEVTDLTDADILPEGLRCRRRKGSIANITAWTPRLRAAVTELQRLRKAAVVRVRGDYIVPLRAEDRSLLVTEDGAPLQKSSLDSAWQRFMELAIKDKAIAETSKFTLHGLKHKGVTETQGTRAEKKDASGHRSDAAFDVYDHELKIVPAAGEPC